MNTIDKLNNTLGYLTAMSFDRPELSNDLVEPLNTLSEAISEVENLSLSGVSIALPSRKDYDERKLKPMYFKKTTSVDNCVLFIKGDEWQPYNWNYDRTIEYLKGGRLGYEC